MSMIERSLALRLETRKASEILRNIVEPNWFGPFILSDNIENDWFLNWIEPRGVGVLGVEIGDVTGVPVTFTFVISVSAAS